MSIDVKPPARESNANQVLSLDRTNRSMAARDNPVIGLQVGLSNTQRNIHFRNCKQSFNYSYQSPATRIKTRQGNRP